MYSYIFQPFRCQEISSQFNLHEKQPCSQNAYFSAKSARKYAQIPHNAAAEKNLHKQNNNTTLTYFCTSVGYLSF